MKKLIKKAVDYAKNNPEKTKHYAKKAYDTIQKKKSKSRTERPR
ncbi:hypothetical protein QRD89_13370 [Halobacillus sp. ACCC02827]|nr:MULTISPECIES: hypothetical protein [Bacillaceae]WJE14699.1 hypothetical protein QRD89_13370 [Halobacillus sp. ACCC02827]